MLLDDDHELESNVQSMETCLLCWGGIAGLWWNLEIFTPRLNQLPITKYFIGGKETGESNFL